MREEIGPAGRSRLSRRLRGEADIHGKLRPHHLRSASLKVRIEIVKIDNLSGLGLPRPVLGRKS